MVKHEVEPITLGVDLGGTKILAAVVDEADLAGGDGFLGEARDRCGGCSHVEPDDSHEMAARHARRYTVMPRTLLIFMARSLMSPVMPRENWVSGMHWARPPPAAEPLILKVGPLLGCRIAPATSRAARSAGCTDASAARRATGWSRQR